jgi:gamma-glutamyltranspeptidase/glutathione hydrolase
MCSRTLSALLLALLLSGCAATRPDTSEGLASSAAGIIVSDDASASDAGLEILNQGGNAIDAAVATAFALAVVYPEAGNLGGGGFLVARLASGHSAALDFREKAPLHATPDMFLGPDGEPTEGSLIGHRASGVPGSVAGLWEAHHTYGRLPWTAVLAPALRLARNGFPVSQRFARTIRADSAILARFDATRQLLFREGRIPDPGTLWKNPDLARTLDRIATQGCDGFYAGETADCIVEEMSRGGGLITREDLASYRAVWRTPVTFSYRSHTVISMPPPSSGGVTLALLCAILGGDDIHALGWNSATTVHTEAEAMRRAFAIRNAFLGDPDVISIPLDSLLSPDVTSTLRRDISPTQATPSSQVNVSPHAPARDGSHTTHLSAVDAEGNAVGLTTTLNGLYGSGVSVPGAGFLLNNEMDDFTVKPGTPNMFGLVQGEANAIAPGKRILSSMTPTIVCSADGAPLIVTGARGGPHIITAVFQVLSNILDHGMDLPAAITAPRFHHQHLPDCLLYEEGALAPDAVRSLRQLGHTLREAGALGSAPTLLHHGARWSGMGDPRTGGAARGQSLLP